MDDFQKLVYVRWQALPDDYAISVGGYGTITKNEALKHVANNDEIGKILIAVDRNYFEKLKSGAIYESFDN
ncbi:hypothetical protein IJG27_01380 [Candidatus Saccharibacteria bacterium]|nr:hypothetical protein [Candidatus Saccharibacteria bacterium]